MLSGAMEPVPCGASGPEGEPQPWPSPSPALAFHHFLTYGPPTWACPPTPPGTPGQIPELCLPGEVLRFLTVQAGKLRHMYI